MQPVPTNVCRAGGRRRGRGVAALLALGTVGGAIIALSAPVRAADTGTIDPKRIFAQSEPATVMILADFSADATVPSVELNQQALQDELVSEAVQGKIDPNDTAGLFTRSIQLLIASPETFFSEGPPRQAKAEFQATGSGFIIDETGYIVTNAHVAAPHDDEIKKQLAQIGLKSLVEDDVKGMEADLKSNGVSLSNDLFQQLVNADAGWVAKRLQVSNQQKTISAVLGANIPGVSTGINLVPGSVVTAGDPIPGRDVAIVKIEQKNLPTLPLGDDLALRPGDKLYVLGYPGAATFHPLIAKESITEPSFTAGQMSARKVSTGGFDVLQTDAAVTHGNSGGPVFNDKGQVIGLATFGSIGQDNTELSGFNFIMPSTLVKQFVDRSGAHPKQSVFSTLYSKALDQEAAGKAKAALATFAEINTLSPGHPYVQQHISANQALVSSGKGGSDSSSKTGLIAGVAAAALLLLLVGGFFILRGRKRQPAFVGAGTATMVSPTSVTPPLAGLPPSMQHPPSMAPPAPMAPPPPMQATMPMPATTPMPATAGSDDVAHHFCGNCGAVLSGQPFCGSCGHAVS